MVSGVLPAVPFLHYFLDANQFEYVFYFIMFHRLSPWRIASPRLTGINVGGQDFRATCAGAIGFYGGMPCATFVRR